MRPSTAGVGPGLDDGRLARRQVGGGDPRHEDGDVQEAARPVRGEMHREAALVLGDRRVPGQASRVERTSSPSMRRNDPTATTSGVWSVA